LQLIELPSLARHNLVFGSAPRQLCCDERTSIEFRTGGALQASTTFSDLQQSQALWLDFSASGTLQRSRLLPMGARLNGSAPAVPRLLRRKDGTEVAVGRPESILRNIVHDQLFRAAPGPGAVEFQKLSFIDADHLSPVLTPDGRWILYTMRDPLSGYLQLFRMELP
jgi:hypothetical protein